MEYRRFGSMIIARLDKGEEILEQLRAISLAEQVKLAQVSALGALDEFTAGVFDTGTKQFFPNTFHGAYEIVSLTGTVTTMDGAYYSHLHMSAGDREGRVFGGHLSRARISATCEMVIQIIEGRVDRAFDRETGLNLFKFD